MDKEYWLKFYQSKPDITKPSLFAKFVVENFAKKQHRVLELGCGNGRDAFFLCKHVHSVIAIDQCCVSNTKDNLQFIEADFTKCKVEEIGKFDLIYSRFTMHAIKHSQMLDCFSFAFSALNNGGIFACEARGEKNELFQKGILSNDEKNMYFYDNHYRRFLNKEQTEQELISSGLSIYSSEEEKGFAPFKHENHYFLRIISTKGEIQ